MGQPNDPPATPKDANKATEELQDEFDHKDDDPDAPGSHQTRKQVADETSLRAGLRGGPGLSNLYRPTTAIAHYRLDPEY